MTEVVQARRRRSAAKRYRSIADTHHARLRRPSDVPADGIGRRNRPQQDERCPCTTSHTSTGRSPTRPTPPSPTASRARPQGPRRRRAGRRPHGARRRRAPARRLARSATSTRSRRRSTSSRASCCCELDGHVHRLVAGRLRAVPIGTCTRSATPATSQVRWLSREHAAAARAGRRRQGHVLRGRAARPRGADARRRAAGVRRPAAALRRPLRRHAAAGRGARGSTDPARGRRPVGMDTALSSTAGSA